MTLKGREVSLAQGNVVPVGVMQGSVAVGKSRVQGIVMLGFGSVRFRGTFCRTAHRTMGPI